MSLRIFFPCKFDKKATKTIVVGYEDNSSNYRLYDCTPRKVTVGRHVTFMEDSEEAAPIKKPLEDVEIFDSVIEIQDKEAGVDREVDHQNEEADEQAEAVEENIIAPAPRESPMLQPGELRDRSSMRRPARYSTNFVTSKSPTSFQEATTGPHAEEWRKAINKELAAHQKNCTWKLIPREHHMRTIDPKWVFKLTQNSEEEAPRFKARPCARGFMATRDRFQRDLLTCIEVRFAPSTAVHRHPRRPEDAVF